MEWISCKVSSNSSTKPSTTSLLATGLYHWATCVFIIFLVFSQLLGAIWNSTSTDTHILYGKHPDLGPFQIVGTNDSPYTDRVIACVGKGEFYEPKLVSSLLAAPGETALLEDSTGTATHGYRLKQRKENIITDVLDSAVEPIYVKSCELIAQTIRNIQDACSALGYEELIRDHLRVVDDWNSTNLFSLPNTLPILILPFWDNGAFARHAIPTYTGDSCVFRLSDAYSSTASMSTYAYFHGVNQTVRHNRTVGWLKRPGGDWRNGWYEDKEGGRWYSEVLSSAPGDPYNMMHRVFDMTKGKELDCSNPDSCEAPRYSESWGNKFQVISGIRRFSSVYIANATEFGLFTYECYRFSEVKSVFDWETLLANVYTVWILHRWVLAQFLILSSGLNRKNQHFGGGINLVSSSKNFRILPIVSLPRLRMTLIAFWTVRCSFEGQQQALAEAWFAIYPAIAHFVLIYFSLLDLLGKILRRRVSDVLFGPTIFILCLLHYCRQPLASSGWLQDVDGRVATVVFSDEVDKIQLADFITSDIAWLLNGRVSFVYSFKWCLLGINLLPLLVSRSLPILPRGNSKLNGVEKALALSVRNVGGLGTSPPYILMAVDGILSSSSHLRPRKSQTEVVPFLDEHEMRQKSDGGQRQVCLVSNFELIRLGYVVFDDRYLTTFQEWGRMTAMAPFRAIFHLWNHRVLVWTLRPLSTNGDAEIAGGRALECTEPQLWRLDDPRLQNFKWWQVSACTIQC